MFPVCVQTLYVRDLARAVDFHAHALGYQVEATFGDCIAQLVTHDMVLVIQQIEDDDPIEPGTVLAYQVDDIHDAADRVRAAGGTLLHEQPVRCPVGWVIRFRDPAGIVHELLQFDEEVEAG